MGEYYRATDVRPFVGWQTMFLRCQYLRGQAIALTLETLLVALPVLGLVSSRAGTTTSGCSAVSFTAVLNAGQSLRRKVADLAFEIRATKDKGVCDGWTFSLEDASGHDFIYPVNMPLRFNPSQILGCSYGLTASQGLEMKRTLRFILSEQEYLRLDPLMRNALWPGDSPDPHAAETHLKAIAAVQTGLVRLNTLHFEISPDGMVRSATFRVELIAPKGFHFDPGVKSYSTACPVTPAQ
jgi:hypothetical protein